MGHWFNNNIIIIYLFYCYSSLFLLVFAPKLNFNIFLEFINILLMASGYHKLIVYFILSLLNNFELIHLSLWLIANNFNVLHILLLLYKIFNSKRHFVSIKHRQIEFTEYQLNSISIQIIIITTAIILYEILVLKILKCVLSICCLDNS